MRNLFNWAAARIVAAFALILPIAAIAEVQMTNPVTGELECYTNSFVGATEWNSAANWDTEFTPFISGGDYNPALVTGKVVSTSTAINGWTLRVGAYNGATIHWSGGIEKIQSGTIGCWLTADETSEIRIDSFAGHQLEGSDSAPFKLSSASAIGIIWSKGLTSTSSSGDMQIPFWYYLKGAGKVTYGGDITVANAQVIKQADVTLSGTSQVASKTLVTFGSGTTKAFTADAAIKVKNGDVVLKTVYVNSVRSSGETRANTTSNLSAENDAVGSCEIVQCTDGIVLFWVDGNAGSVTGYKRSININFTNGNGLTTTDDVGLGGYAVPGTSWNNFTIPNNANEQTFSTLNAIDSTGAASVASGVSVTVSGHRGSYNCSNLDAASNPLHGYIDEGAEKATPTVTITGIPYEHYRVIVYHSTDTANVPFGYDTINGFNFTYVNGVQTTGTDSWGASGADQSAEPIGEGTNTLVSAVLSGDTVTMVAHRIGGGTPTARGCFAAIQVVEYVPEVGENDLEIAVNGATDYPVDAAKNLSGTVYLTGSGTLTLSGSEKITAATIDVGSDVILNINADRLDATTFTGAGTVVYDGAAPVAGKGWAAIGWSGTVWIKNYAIGGLNPGDFANVSSTLRLSVCTGYFNDGNNTKTCAGTLDLQNDTGAYAFAVDNGWSTEGKTIFAKLTGSGTLDVQTKDIAQRYIFKDASGFTGTINLAGRPLRVIFGDGESLAPAEGTITVASGATVTVPSGKTWTANKNGFVVNGTLNVAGTLSSTAASAVSGSGTVVFGGVPSPTGDAWWKNSAWTGTVQVNGYSSMAGTIPFNDCGNADSIVELKNVTGWINANYTCTPKLKITGTLYLNNGSSNKSNAFKVGTLLGDGTISGDGNAPTVVFNVTTDWSGFTGTIGLNNKCVVFGSTIPDSLTAGTIYVSSGAVVTPQQSSGVWWAVGGIKVDGELRAPNLDKFGGGTTITTSDAGVFTFINSNNTQDQSVDYARITGTGTLRYADVSGKWRTLSRVNFPTGMICENNLSEGLILQAVGAEHVIGSLAGSGVMRSDWTSGNRSLKILQAKDTVYSGVFHSDDRISTVTVAPGASTAGTLTLSGEQTVSNDLSIEASVGVNITGTWKGATTVAGTLGGTGTLTGDLTFSDGATFKAFGIDSDGLAVSGTITYPGTGTVTVDFAEVPTADTVLLSASGLDASKFTLAAGVPGGSLAVENNALVYKSPFVIITVPAIEHTAVEVTVDGVVVGPTLLGGTEYAATNGAAVVVTYSAAAGYEVTGGTFEFTVSGPTTIDTTDVAVAQYVAKVRNLSTSEYDEYTTLAAAIAAADGTTHANSIMLIAGVTESEVTVSSAIVISGNYTINADVKVATGGQLQLMLAVLSGKLTIEDGGVYATNGGALDTVVAKDGAKIQLTTLSADTAPLTVTTLTVEGELMVVSSYASAERGTTYKALSYVTANATFETGAEIVGGGEWTNGAVVDGDNTVVTLAITAVAKVGDVYYDDLADAIAAAGGVEVVDLMVAPAETIKLGAGETLKIKKYSFEVSVALADGLLTPPHYLEFETDSSTLVSTYTVKSYVAAIGDDKYESLAAAIEAATAGQTVTLLADDHVSFSAGNLEIAISKALTIDGAGYTVYGVNDYAYDGVHDHDIYISGSSDVTIKNVTLANFAGGVGNNMRTYPIWAGQAYAGTLTLDNVTVQNFNRTAFNLNGGTVVVTNCTITGDTTKEAYFQEGIAVYNANVTIVDTAISNVGSNLEKEDSQIAACIQLGNPNGSATGTGSITVVNGTYSGEYGIIVASNAQNTVSVQGGTFAGDLMVEEGEGGTIAVSGGTFDAEVPAEYCADGYEPKDNGDGTYTVSMAWIYAVPGYWERTGTWSEGATLGEDKVTIESNATYTASNPSAGQMVTVEMTLSFDDANDEDEDVGDAKAAVRLASGETSGTYQFQLYTSDGVNKVWTNATVEAITATKEHDYTFVFVLDLTNKVYTATVVDDVTTNVMTVGGATNIPFAYQGDVTPVQKIEFIGAGSVTSIEGSYEDAPAPAVFVEDEPITLADGGIQLSADQAAWLNKLGAKLAVANRLEQLASARFSAAYLLNLDLMGDFTYEFKVTGITVGDSAVEVEVTLTRTGTLVDGEASINGTLTLKGTADLDTPFVEIASEALSFDLNSDFSDGEQISTEMVATSIVTIDTSETEAKFYKPLIK